MLHMTQWLWEVQVVMFTSLVRVRRAKYLRAYTRMADAAPFLLVSGAWAGNFLSKNHMTMRSITDAQQRKNIPLRRVLVGEDGATTGSPFLPRPTNAGGSAINYVEVLAHRCLQTCPWKVCKEGGKGIELALFVGVVSSACRCQQPALETISDT